MGNLAENVSYIGLIKKRFLRRFFIFFMEVEVEVKVDFLFFFARKVEDNYDVEDEVADEDDI